MEHARLLLLIMGNFLASTDLLDCSVENNTTCDCVHNATLDTAEYYEKYRDCDWSLRNKEDIVLQLLTPVPHVTVPCSWHEVYLKLNCDSPKHEVILHWYKFESKTEHISSGETPLQSHVSILCLWCLRYLL